MYSLNTTKKVQPKSPEALLGQATKQYEQGDYSKAYRILTEIEQIASMIAIAPTVEVRMTNRKGVIHMMKGEYRAAERYLLLSIAQAEKLQDAKLIYTRHDNIGGLYIESKQFDLAIKHIQSALRIKEQTGNEQALANGYIQLASLQFTMDDTVSGKASLERAAQLIAQYKQSRLLIHYHGVLGMQQRREKKYQEALASFAITIQYAIEYNENHTLLKAYGNLCGALVSLERWDEAEEKYRLSLKFAKEFNMALEILSIMINLGKIALHKKDVVGCRELFMQIQFYASGTDSDVIQIDLKELESQLLEAESNPLQALEAYKQHIYFYKRYYDNELSHAVFNSQSRFEREKISHELEYAKRMQAESELKVLKAEHKLLDMAKRFKLMVEYGSDMIAILHADLRPFYASPSVYKILGYSKAEYLEQNLFQLIHPEDRAIAVNQLKEIKKQPNTPVSCEFRFPKKSGEYIWVDGTVINMLENESVAGIICSFKDITQRKKNEQQILRFNQSLKLKVKQRTAELEDANDALKSFSYSVSHDLRSPLHIVDGYLAILHDEYAKKMGKEAMSYIISIMQNTERMGLLIQNLLNLSQSGKDALNIEHVDMNHTVQFVLAMQEEEDKNSTKNIKVKKLKAMDCDMALIKQVWSNLISNAIKYSSKTKNPMIEIGSMLKNKETVYYVKDNGTGFNMKFAHKLFKIFHRLHAKDEFAGIGVGLALVHRIITKHGGKVWADAKVGMGATFYFTIGSKPKK